MRQDAGFAHAPTAFGGNGLELWGGHECTLNRVGDDYADQTLLSGHEDRPEDIERFAALGLKRLRYPALWERTEVSQRVLDFRWLDDRLTRVRAVGITPILGLMHHGSGPRWTSLIDEGFPQAFAAYAAAVAHRYPWADAYTPINEPLTTARFSCLYGHWYPHRRDERAMWLALLNQIDATRLAMREIRAVNPGAKLVQTEDLGRCQSTPKLAYQADFENQRRWLTWDLLAGKVVAGHPLHDHLSRQGFAERLARIAADPCPPDVVGVNHYPTSDRFLDDQVEAYPPGFTGGDDRGAYVDVEAARVSSDGMCGFEPLLREAWGRYGRPLAITECHNGCTREEQLRWLTEAWTGAQSLRRQGCDVVAVTAWSLLGAYDWDSLLTRSNGRYESGVFDLRSPQPRATALVGLLQSLTRGDAAPPLAAAPGWWRRDVRLTLGRSVRPAQPAITGRTPEGPQARRRPILIIGATGTLGQALARACILRGLAFHLTSRTELQIDDAGSLDRAVSQFEPWAVVNAAGWVRVDDAEAEEAACFAANADGPGTLAARCAAAEIPFVTFSSDQVFDGSQARPYVEADELGPLNAYGRSKLAAERAVLAAGGRSLIVRTAAFFQEADSHNFAVRTLTRFAEGHGVEAADDLVVSPTYVPDLVRATLDLLIDGETGIWHLANQGCVSWFDFARLLAAAAGHDERLVTPRPSASFGWPARRPAFVALGSNRAQLLPSLSDAIGRFVEGHRALHPATSGSCPPSRVAA